MGWADEKLRLATYNYTKFYTHVTINLNVATYVRTWCSYSHYASVPRRLYFQLITTQTYKFSDYNNYIIGASFSLHM